MKRSLRAIPAVEKVLQSLGPQEAPRPVVVALVRRELAALRRNKPIPAFEQIVATIKTQLGRLQRSRIQPVINGTGVIVHTNLGRSPLSERATQALVAVATNFNNLEYDLTDGSRGQRAAYLEANLAILCGAEAATVVNNCAAALVLVLRHFITPQRDEVIISRGELIQIGGGFRIPEVLESSGARLREIGTTNKTAVGDYAKAMGARTALILKVHRSNFFMGGFVESPPTEDIAALARKKRVPFVEDLGSGAVLPTQTIEGLSHEPTPVEIFRQGVDLVTFSGDKLLGGPQAGIVAGKQKMIAALKREPLFRALRCDKLVLAALEATVDDYLQDRADQVPIVRMLRTPLAELQARAERIVAAFGEKAGLSTGEGRSEVGGGTLPASSLPSITLELTTAQPELVAERLRSFAPPVIGYIAGKRFKIDLRTVFPSQDAILIQALRQVVELNR